MARTFKSPKPSSNKKAKPGSEQKGGAANMPPANTPQTDGNGAPGAATGKDDGK